MINSFKINNFLNKSDIELNLQPKLNVLVGDNNSGKTSILDEIYKVSNTKTIYLKPHKLKSQLQTVQFKSILTSIDEVDERFDKLKVLVNKVIYPRIFDFELEMFVNWKYYDKISVLECLEQESIPIYSLTKTQQWYILMYFAAYSSPNLLLIDDIEHYIDVKSQRELINDLMSLSLNTQFVISTRSPFIVNNVDKDNIYLLKDSKVYRPRIPTSGCDIHGLMLSLFELRDRPDWSAKLIEECGRLMDKEQWNEAKIKLDELRELLGRCDNDIVRLQTIYDFHN